LAKNVPLGRGVGDAAQIKVGVSVFTDTPKPGLTGGGEYGGFGALKLAEVYGPLSGLTSRTRQYSTTFLGKSSVGVYVESVTGVLTTG
jgi:hypothetical protein